jgi:hypothetical protein
MAPRNKMTAEEKRWRAQDDAHALAAAEEILADKNRLAAAKKEAQKMAQAAVNQANKYVSVAKKTVKKAAPKRRPTAKKKAAPKRRALKKR